jgi:hypothetical protein
MVNGHDASLRGEETLVGLKVEDTFVTERNGTKGGTGKLPRDDIGVVFHAGNDNLVVTREETFGERRGYEVDTVSGAAGEDNLVTVAGVDEGLHLTAHGLIALRSGSGEVVGTAVDITVEGSVVAVESLDDP